MRRPPRLIALAASGTAITALSLMVAGAGPAAASPTTQELVCDGHSLVIRTNQNHSSDNGGWSVAQVESGDGHLIPVSFTFSAFDETTDEQLFEFTQQKGGGHANHNQDTVACTQTETGKLGDFLEPGDEVPPGANVNDTVTVTFTALAVEKP